MAVIVISAILPWYALRLFPLVTIGTAKINLLDALVACATLVALPSILQALRTGPREMWWACAFVAYTTVPLGIGIRDPDARFFAIREWQALVFYLLALAFVAGGYGPRDSRNFAGAYVAGTTAAAIAVFAHVRWLTPLPGYPLPILRATWVQYLEWTVPIVAFFLGMIQTLTASSRWTQGGWIAAIVAVAWYVFASGERFLQALIVAITAVLLGLPALGGLRPRHAAIVVAIVVCLGLGTLGGPAWLRTSAHTTWYRWSTVLSDNSLAFRIEELRGGLSRFVHHPVVGEGLGGLVIHDDPAHHGLPWRYIANGYGFLLIKMGLVGFLLYLGMAGSALRAGWRRLHAPRADDVWPAALVGILGMGILLFVNFLYPTVDTPEGAIAFSLFYGMLVSPRTRGGASGLPPRVLPTVT